MTAEQDPRPRPQYGEYSDAAAEAAKQAEAATQAEAANPAAASTDGASPAETSDAAAVTPTSQQAPAEASFAAPGAAAGSAPGSAAGPIPGVPHNLGVRGGSATQPGAAAPAAQQPSPQQPSPQHGDPYRGQAPANQAAPTQAAPAATAQQAQQTGQQPQQGQQPAMFQPQPGSPYGAKKPRRADRIITVILLVIGGYFALSMALSLSQLGLEFSKIADALGLENYSPSPALKTTGTVGAILVLAVYALVLIFSIRRMRSGKLTFWAPLAAGVLAWIIFFVLFTVGINQSPELWQELIRVASDPKATQDLLDTLSTPSNS